MARNNTSHDYKTCQYYRQIKPRRITPVSFTPSESESESELEVTQMFDNVQDIHTTPTSPEDNVDIDGANEIESGEEHHPMIMTVRRLQKEYKAQLQEMKGTALLTTIGTVVTE